MAREEVKPEGEPKKRRLGCLGKIFILLLLLIALLGVLNVVMTPEKIKDASGNKEKAVEAINKYRDLHGSLPASLKDLGDNRIEGYYWYYHDDDKMFLLKYQGAGLMGDGIGEFYRSDKKEWKNVSANRKEYFELENKLMHKKE
jgi:hypothetical protein